MNKILEWLNNIFSAVLLCCAYFGGFRIAFVILGIYPPAQKWSGEKFLVVAAYSGLIFWITVIIIISIGTLCYVGK